MKNCSKTNISNISDTELSKITGIPKTTLRLWSKTDKDNWRYKHYWLLKSFSKEYLFAQMKKVEDILKEQKEK